MDIYVGNLPYSATEEQLGELFASFGPVKRVTIIKDRETGRPKGFGFVSLGDELQAQAAIEAINGSEFGGRALKVNATDPKPRVGGGGGERRDHPKGDRQVRNDYGDDGHRPQRGGGKPKSKPKGSQRGKRGHQKGGFEEDW